MPINNNCHTQQKLIPLILNQMQEGEEHKHTQVGCREEIHHFRKHTLAYMWVLQLPQPEKKINQ